MINQKVALVVASLFVGTSTQLLAQAGDRGGIDAQADVDPRIKAITPPAPFLTAEQQLKTFKVAPGFRVEIVATEPLVQEPVTMQFAPDGKLWVVEMRAYMMDVDGKDENAPIGDIAVLEDTDGDGRFDKKTIFLDNLDSPRAVALVDGGALVAAPTNLWYYKDTNGDGVADQKIDVSSTYGTNGGPEHNANGLMWGLDNWIYNANYSTRYRYQGNGRFLADNTQPSRGQWGITQDDAGRIFYNSNMNPLMVDLVHPSYLRRNAGVPGSGTGANIAAGRLTIFPSRPQPGINRGYQSLNEDGTYSAVTSACGPVAYRGTLFPKEFLNDIFICEPTANLVKRIKITEANGTLVATNAYPDGQEFLTSTDERFRPVNIFNGPDGALYIVDMYHGVIQHKNFVTTYLRKQIIERGLENPIHVGRIFRIVPDNAPARPVMANLSRSTPAQLVNSLGDANGWTRDTAQRLLVEKLDKSIAPNVRTFVNTAATPALGKVHGLWVLDGLDSLDRDTALKAMNDSDPRVQAAALRVSEKLFVAAPAAASTSNPLVDRAIALAKSADANVRLQAAFSLGEARTPAADAALRQLLIANPTQPLLSDAVVSSLAGRDDKFVLALIEEARNAAEPPAREVTLVTNSVLRSNDAGRINNLLETTLSDGSPAWARKAVLDALQNFSGGGAAAGGGARGAGAGGGRGGAAPAANAAAPAAGGGRGARGAAPGVNPEDAGGAQIAAAGGGGRGGGGRGGGGAAAGTLPSEPKALQALASRKSGEDSTRAGTILETIRWTGKPGLDVVPVTPLNAEQQALFAKGKTGYEKICMACHQANGQGQAGIGLPLVNSAYVNGDDRVLARLVLAGKVDTTTTPPIMTMVMPPARTLFTDEELAGILTYIRRSWGNTANPVTVATVAEARAAVADKQDNWTEVTLQAAARQLPALGGRGGGARGGRGGRGGAVPAAAPAPATAPTPVPATVPAR